MISTTTSRLRRINPVQLGLVLGLVYAVLALLFAILYAIFGAALLQSMHTVYVPAAGIGFIIVAPIAYFIGGFIGGIIVGALYNLVAGWIGGVELTFDIVT
jgi:TRAP-type C4-dicarboxylate transport system permease small subunit